MSVILNGPYFTLFAYGSWLFAWLGSEAVWDKCFGFCRGILTETEVFLQCFWKEYNCEKLLFPVALWPLTCSFLCHQSRVKSLTEPFKEWSWNSTGLNSSHWFPFTTYGKHLSNLRIWDWIISGFQLNTCGTKVVINFKSTCRMYCWVCSAWILTFLKEKLVR